MITIEDAKNYLGIDIVDDMINANLTRAINDADAYMIGAVGKNYPQDDPRAERLMLMVVADLYDDRGFMSGKTAGTIRQLTADYMLHLKLELARGGGAK